MDCKQGEVLSLLCTLSLFLSRSSEMNFYWNVLKWQSESGCRTGDMTTEIEMEDNLIADSQYCNIQPWFCQIGLRESKVKAHLKYYW